MPLPSSGSWRASSSFSFLSLNENAGAMWMLGLAAQEDDIGPWQLQVASKKVF